MLIQEIFAIKQYYYNMIVGRIREESIHIRIRDLFLLGNLLSGFNVG